MPSDSTEKSRSTASNPPPKLDEPLPCPRCDSRTTKFCYYNNYNLSQPRYFCKSCRRYWTQGGALRNVPVGGGSRKSTKRPRPATTSAPPLPIAAANGSSSSCPMTTSLESDTVAVTAEPVSVIPVQEMKPEMGTGNVINLNESLGSLTNPQGHGFLTLGGYGLDPFWGYSGGGFLGAGAVGGTPAFNSWQAPGDVDGGGGFVDGDSFAWPGLAISTYGKSMK